MCCLGVFEKPHVDAPAVQVHRRAILGTPSSALVTTKSQWCFTRGWLLPALSIPSLADKCACDHPVANSNIRKSRSSIASTSFFFFSEKFKNIKKNHFVNIHFYCVSKKFIISFILVCNVYMHGYR